MIQGVILKGIGGFYYVDTGKDIYECRARGKFRLDKVTPLVGDLVEIEANEATKQGYLLNILPRKNEMIRPSIANIDQVLMVFAAKKPDINLELLQKFILYAEYLALDVIISINKIDLDEEGKYKEICDMLRSVPYKVIETSTVKDIGINEIKSVLKDKTTVFAGPSGTGKSSILNMVQPGLRLKTGGLSKKTDRGTHTTRHAELIKLELGGVVADTPGFTSLDISEIAYDKLQGYFPEFYEHVNCKFSGCLHDTEPGCGLKEAIKKGEINKSRYDFYIETLRELKNIRRY